MAGAIFGLTACQSGVNVRQTNVETNKQSQKSMTEGAAFSQFPGIPVPQGAKIDVNKTLVFGSSPWYGQLAITTSDSVDEVFDFFQQGLPGYKWETITSVRAQTSILTYSQQNRILTVAIQADRLYGSTVTITVAPRGSAPTKASPAPVQTAPFPQGNLKPTDL